VHRLIPDESNLHAATGFTEVFLATRGRYSACLTLVGGLPWRCDGV
jgi:hypothetical protein